MNDFPVKNVFTNDISRRKFLSACAVCAAGAALLPGCRKTSTKIPPLYTVDNVKTRIKLVFAYPDPEYPNWPNIGYDFKGYSEKLTGMFKEKCPNVDFSTVSTMNGSAEEGQKILQENKEVDGCILYHVGCLWGNLTETIASSGKPTVLVDHLFAGSGEFLTSFARVKRQGHKVIAVSSSDFNDVVEAVKCLETLKKMQSSTILVIGGNPDPGVEQIYGTSVSKVEFTEINDAYNSQKPEEIKKWTDKWMGEAAKVIEPPREDIEKAAGMYLAMIDVLKNNQAHAITTNCLGGIYSGNMVEAYPCVGFMQLDNDGLVGACEADQRSTVTKLIMTYLAGRPGFISDPVIDTAKNQIIYAHCVAPTKVYGPDGSSNPYHLRSHSEDRKGASVRSLMPLGEMTTTILFDHNRKQVIFHQGRSVENIDDDKACRTKLAVEVKGDVFKLLNYWDEWGWHRVTFYGDLKRPVYDIAALLGFEVVEEA
ncbi:twin-arginine translocation signal domain-containing protein [candidate division KSB1 bacterium]